jgi:hypothetical protein
LLSVSGKTMRDRLQWSAIERFIMDLTEYIQIRSSSRGLAATNLRIHLQIWQWIPTGKNAAAGTHKSTACSDYE